MILESSNYVFWTLHTEKPSAGLFPKTIRFKWLNTEKHGFLYDTMILKLSNYDFWTLRTEKHLGGILSKIIHFEWLNAEKRVFCMIEWS